MTSPRAAVPRVHIVGRRNAGKTTLLCELVRELTGRGLRVATIKHTHHQHEFDTPGKDSWKHRMAGAQAVGILSPSLRAAFVTPAPTLPADAPDDRYEFFGSVFQQMHLVLVEGDLHTSAPKIEVWREATGQAPCATEVPGIHAVVSDDPVSDWEGAIWARNEICAVADHVCTLCGVP